MQLGQKGLFQSPNGFIGLSAPGSTWRGQRPLDVSIPKRVHRPFSLCVPDAIRGYPERFQSPNGFIGLSAGG